MIVHVASSFENASKAQAVMRALEAAGHAIARNWTSFASHQQSDASRKRLEGIGCAEAVVVVLPAGRSSHVEMGIALGGGHPVVLLAEDVSQLLNKQDGRVCSYYRHPGVHITRALDEVIAVINGYRARAL